MPLHTVLRDCRKYAWHPFTPALQPPIGNKPFRG